MVQANQKARPVGHVLTAVQSRPRSDMLNLSGAMNSDRAFVLLLEGGTRHG
jgi:hypothetical protein